MGPQEGGYWIVSRIQRDLEEAELVAEPSFTQGWIDAPVTLVPKRLLESKTAPSNEDEVSPPRQEGATEPGEVTLLVGSLRSAGQGVCSVSLNSTLREAQSLMMRNDYSQLAVMSDPRTLRGAVTWESIAQASMRTSNPQIRDSVIPAELVRFEDDLIHHIPRIVQAGYVFVQAKNRTVSGILTTADLSDEFARLATPFFLIGEIERRLRRAADRIFSPAELMEIRDPNDSTRDVASAEDLTIGEYVRLFEYPERWDKTGWKVDRKIFIEALNQARELRNDVLHFSPDPLDEDQLDELRRFIRWLRILLVARRVRRAIHRRYPDSRTHPIPPRFRRAVTRASSASTKRSRYFVAPVSEITQESLWNVLRDSEAVADACGVLGVQRISPLRAPSC
jgi:CBS domain-containing protein